jgi:hypothetical protein
MEHCASCGGRGAILCGTEWAGVKETASEYIKLRFAESGEGGLHASFETALHDLNQVEKRGVGHKMGNCRVSVSMQGSL